MGKRLAHKQELSRTAAYDSRRVYRSAWLSWFLSGRAKEEAETSVRKNEVQTRASIPSRNIRRGRIASPPSLRNDKLMSSEESFGGGGGHRSAKENIRGTYPHIPHFCVLRNGIDIQLLPAPNARAGTLATLSPFHVYSAIPAVKWLEKGLIRMKTGLYRGFRTFYSLVGYPRRILENLAQQGLISCESDQAGFDWVRLGSTGLW